MSSSATPQKELAGKAVGEVEKAVATQGSTKPAAEQQQQAADLAQPAAENPEKPVKMKRLIYSTPKFDVADFADERSTCCRAPLRWATLFWSAFFLVGGIVQLVAQILQKEYSWGDAGRDMLTISAVSMVVAGASGFVGAIFEVRYPVTIFAVMLSIQIILEFCWFFLAEGESAKGKKNSVADICQMLYHEVISGSRSGESGVAAHLFYTLFSVTFHVIAGGAVASYALELRIQGKTVWFEPIFDSEDEDEDEKGEESALESGQPKPSYGAVK